MNQQVTDPRGRRILKYILSLNNLTNLLLPLSFVGAIIYSIRYWISTKDPRPKLSRASGFHPKDMNMEQPIGSDQSLPEPSPYHPSVGDVLAVKDVLLKLTLPPVPLELVDKIIDHAEYWPRNVAHIPNIVRTAMGCEPFHENRLILRTQPIGFVDDRGDQNYLRYFYNISLPDREKPSSEVTQKLIKEWQTKSLPRGQPCRKIVFRLKSHDQGWGGSSGRGTYDAAYTWFDVGLEKTCAYKDVTLPEASGFSSASSTESPDGRRKYPSHTSVHNAEPPDFGRLCPQLTYPSQDEGMKCILNTVVPSTTPDPKKGLPHVIFHHSMLPDEFCLQKNRAAHRETQENIITWSCTDNVDSESPEGEALQELGRGRKSANGEYVRNLQYGDVITLWAKARFPGWVNTVEESIVEVYWAV